MGVKITSLGQIPSDIDVAYYVYLLSSHFPLETDRALRDAFDLLAKEARNHNFVVVQGLVGEFGGEVMNAYSIDGIQSDELLPAILISSVNPHKFKEVMSIDKDGPFSENERVVFISLRKAKFSRDEVFQLLEKILKDIKAGKALQDFEVTKDEQTTFLNSLILQPNLSGVGVDLKLLWNFLRGKK